MYLYNIKYKNIVGDLLVKYRYLLPLIQYESYFLKFEKERKGKELIM